MKKVFLLAAMSLGLSLSAQNTVISMVHNGDTVTGSVSKQVDYTAKQLYKSISLQSVVTKVSGTPAGYSYVMGSLDGTNYNIISDSLAHANQTTNTKIFVVDNSPYLYYRIKSVGTGTMSCKVYGYLMANNPSNATVGSVNFKSSYGLTSDTVTNTATNYVQLQAKYGYNYLTIQPIVTKISGTPAGTLTLQGSNDGTNYVTVNTSYIKGGVATLSVTNQNVNSRFFVVTGSPYEYYRVSYTGSGTMSCTLAALAIGK
jgi:hypothetical protein